jgi:hypothetical protein
VGKRMSVRMALNKKEKKKIKTDKTQQKIEEEINKALKRGSHKNTVYF